MFFETVNIVCIGCTGHYNYDIHGNVKQLIQENHVIDGLDFGHELKRTYYEYDLISGNVNQVNYQPGMFDEFYHRYRYDADNRLIRAETSRDGFIWEKESKMFYYPHGPVARTETGDKQVQGTDYAYTIQGWLKGVNSNTLNTARDIGGDAVSSATHQFFATDAFGYSLGYFTGDYSPIATISSSDYFIADESGTNDYTSAIVPLYNGNIANMVNALMDVDQQVIPIMANTYRYDQLNRIRSSTSFTDATMSGNNTWSGSAVNNDDYYSTYHFDYNGNITNLTRNGFTASTQQSMDDLKYYYYTQSGSTYDPVTTTNGALPADATNQLAYVTDAVPASSIYTTDFETQASANYTYDEIGQLITDDIEEIEEIEWDVKGKVRKITRESSSSKPDLEFLYNAMGQRIVKIVKPRTGGTPQDQVKWIYTLYSLDAQGNVLSVYDLNFKALTSVEMRADYIQSEQHIYASSRLGMVNLENKKSTTFDATFNTDGITGVETFGVISNVVQPDFTIDHENGDGNRIYERQLGNKSYELVSSQRNVYGVITDRKLTVGTGSTVSFYTADLISYSDYYPYGMPMPDRNTSTQVYRYGYQNQEKDDEIKGEGNSINYEYRMHDSRIGRFFKVDPLASKYSYNSPYAFSENRVIDGIELEGLEFYGWGGPFYTPKTNTKKDYQTGRASYQPRVEDYENRERSAADAGGAYAWAYSLSAEEHHALWNGSNIATEEDHEFVVQSTMNVALFFVPIERLFILTAKAAQMATLLPPVNIIAKRTFFQKIKSSFKQIKQGIGSLFKAGTKTVIEKFGVEEYVRFFKPASELETTKTLYRGTTGSEAGAKQIFLTDDPAYAASYIKNGGQVYEYEVSNFALFSLEQEGVLTFKTGVEATTGATGKEWVFSGENVVEALNQIAKPKK